MTLTVMRRWARLIAVMLLFTAGRLPHIATDDFACAIGSSPAHGTHDQTKHGLRPGTIADEEHCAVCHWTRTLRAPRTAVSGLDRQVELPSLLHRSDGGVVSAPVRRHLPARAPPSPLL